MITWDEFVAIVDKHFKYLETEFGFERISISEPFVSYESQHLRVSVYWEYSRSRELDLRIVPLVKIERPFLSFGIGGLMRLGDPNASFPSPFPKTREEVEAGVREYARLLRKYGVDVLRGDVHDLVGVVERGRERRKSASGNPGHHANCD